MAAETISVTLRSGWILSRAKNGNARIEAMTEAFWTGGPVLRILRLLVLFRVLDRVRLLVGLRLPSRLRELVRLDLGPTLLCVRYLHQSDRFPFELEPEWVAAAVVDHPTHRRPLLGFGLLDWEVAEEVGVEVIAAEVVLAVHEAEAAVLEVGCRRHLRQT